jgi:DNA replication protein DnaC
MTMKMGMDFNLKDIIGQGSTESNDVQTNLLKNNVEHIRQYANIPTRYKDAEFTAKVQEQEKLITTIKANFNGKNFNEIRDMLIFGGVGTGKTHLVVAMLNKLINANIYCKYVTEHGLLDLYFQKKYDEFNAFKKVNVLVIDELGKRELAEWQMIQLEELISYRYNELLPTIFITNMNEEEFKSFVGDRVASRLRENKVIRVMMSGQDLRGKN